MMNNHLPRVPLLLILLVCLFRPTSSFSSTYSRVKSLTLFSKNNNYNNHEKKEKVLPIPVPPLQVDLDLDNIEIPDPGEVYSAARTSLGLKDKHFLESSLFVSTPLLAFLASFFLYPTTAAMFHGTVNYLSHNNWEPVDGGQLQWSILLPALNGVVMTAISLLYANLISTTGTQLRNRQMNTHEALTSEVQALRSLIQLIHFYPQETQPSFATHLRDYRNSILQDIFDTDPQNLKGANQPLDNYRYQLHYYSSIQNILDPTIRERSYETIQAMANARNRRITSLQTKFPALHYVTITALTCAILLIFLLETDRKVILFLDKFQIRSVWALLVGTLTAIYSIGLDLAYPFIGTYVVPADQLLVDNDNDELVALIQSRSIQKQQQQKHQTLNTEESKFPLLQSCDRQTQTKEQHDNNHNYQPTAEDGELSLYEQYMKSRTDYNHL